MNPHIFREYSIRGIADQDLSDQVVMHIGRAIGTFFTQRGGHRLVVGRDARNSSPRISHALVVGILEAGLHVIDIGVLPTPVHNFATDFYAADGGVMVTASHNPSAYNGLKIRTDHTLQSDELRDIYRLAAETATQTLRSVAGSMQRLDQADPLPVYFECIKAHVDIRPHLKVVIDGGNGTNGLVVPRLLSDLNCQVIQLYCEPDGNFPNRDPDPGAPNALSALSALVRSERAELGLAYDGDGDRLAVVDECGNPVLGDQLLMLLARDVLRHGPAKIVYEVLCTQALADDVIAHGGTPVMTPSGYAFVHQMMRETDAALGGEFSGHLFFNVPGFRFDDSILASIKLLNILSNSQQSLSRLVAQLPAYHSSPQIRLPCPDAIKTQVVEQVKSYFRASYSVDELDGARINFGDGWALVRASNTQPALSLRFEALTKERLEQLKGQVLEQVEYWVAHHGQSLERGSVSTSEALV